MNRNIASLIPVCVAFVLAPLAASAAPITAPTGLNPGDQYRLAFVTSTTTQAFSTNIADYNAFVTTAANSVPELFALGTTWSAIGSTRFFGGHVDARDNTATNPSSTGVALYNLADSLVASNNADLWDSTIANPINVDEHGAILDTLVWTGTFDDGLALFGQELGTFPSSHSTSTIGNSTFTDLRWVHETAAPPANRLSLYAMSGVLTVVPEPSSMALGCLAAAGLAVPMLRRRRHCKR